MGGKKTKIDIKVKPKVSNNGGKKPVKAGSTHTNEKGGVFNTKVILIMKKSKKK